MKNLTTNEIRKMYLDFFASKGHTVVESAPLIPNNDKSLLWINAGMMPFKPFFDGSLVPQNRRLASCQRCIRTNDIENVGVTARHQTMFEMLGNFSIGDYFKSEAIEFAYEFLFDPKYLGFKKEEIYVTVHPDDDETFYKWHLLGIDTDHIIRLEDNFWEIGEGPCGPDTEIFVDRGEAYANAENNDLEMLRQGKDSDRYVEIWNNVFSQFNAKEGLERSSYPELPSKNIDTGMGLERIACILQEVPTNFDIDVFKPIINAISRMSGKEYKNNMEHKVIADHVRTLVFALADGAGFSNEGRGYVLRKLLRRAVRYGRKLGFEKPFMYNLVDEVVAVMKDAYPYLEGKYRETASAIYREEEMFFDRIESGEKRLEELTNNNTTKTISGEDAFKLYDTYGFPFELTEEYLKEIGFTVSKEEFDKCMAKQKEMARSARKQISGMNEQDPLLISYKDNSEFVGYDSLTSDSKIIAIYQNGSFVESLNGEGFLVFDKTPFYAESGGQVSDKGTITVNGIELEVLDVVKTPNKQHLHLVNATTTINKNDSVTCKVKEEFRNNVCKNHSATHLLQKALQEVLSTSVYQAGSKVSNEVLRFDFNYAGKILDNQLILVEKKVNEWINNAYDVSTNIMSIDEAKESGAMALFTEKYDNEVRVVTMGESKELCGGTHVKNTSEIKKFAIKFVESKGANLWRIEATTDTNIERELFEVIKPYNDEMIKLLTKVKKLLSDADENGIELSFTSNIDNTAPTCYEDIVYNKEEINNVRYDVYELEKRYNEQVNAKKLSDTSKYVSEITTVNDKKVLATKVFNFDNNLVKSLVDKLMVENDLKLVFIANVSDSGVNFIVKSNDSNINASNVLKNVMTIANGKGGGSNTFAQGGSSDTTRVGEVLDSVLKQI